MICISWHGHEVARRHTTTKRLTCLQGSKHRERQRDRENLVYNALYNRVTTGGVARQQESFARGEHSQLLSTRDPAKEVLGDCCIIFHAHTPHK